MADEENHPLIADADQTFVSKEALAKTKPQGSRHQHNANAIRYAHDLGLASGLTTLGVKLVRVKKGNQSTEHHRHLNDEEFVYIIASFDELLDEYEDMHPEDQEWLQQIAENINRSDELPDLEEEEE